MKSLFNCLIRSAIVIGVSTCSTASLVAEEAEAVGIVRISKPKSQAVDRGRVTQVSAFHPQEGCTPGGCVAAYSPPVTQGCPTPVASTCQTGGMCDDSCNFPRQGLLNRGWRGGDSWGMATQDNMGWDGSSRQTLFNRGGRGAGGWDRGMACDDGSCDQGFGGSHGCRNGSCSTHQKMLDYFRCKFGYFIPSGGGGQGIPWTGHYARVYPVNPQYSDPRDGQTYAAQGYGIPMAVPLAPVVAHTYDYGAGIPSSRLTPISHPAN